MIPDFEKELIKVTLLQMLLGFVDLMVFVTGTFVLLTVLEVGKDLEWWRYAVAGASQLFLILWARTVPERRF